MRDLRAQVAREREAGALILAKGDGGYFLPDEGEKGRDELRRFLFTTRLKAISLWRATIPAWEELERQVMEVVRMAGRHKAAKNVELRPWLPANKDCRDGRFIQVGNSLLLSDAFKRLKGSEHKTYFSLCMESGGKPDSNFLTIPRREDVRH